MSSYHVALTLEVEANNPRDALTLAAGAAMGMAGERGVEHCYMARDATPLFDSQPFAQMAGQTTMGG